MSSTDLISAYLGMKAEWIKTNNAFKQAQDAHKESIEALREAENNLLAYMAENEIPRLQFEDKLFRVDYSNTSVVNKELALEIIENNGLLKKFANLTLTNLKKHKLDCVEGIISYEKTPCLKVEISE